MIHAPRTMVVVHRNAMYLRMNSNVPVILVTDYLKIARLAWVCCLCCLIYFDRKYILIRLFILFFISVCLYVAL